MLEKNTCCFIGHRGIEKTEELKRQLTAVVEELITAKQVDTFLFGSKSAFNDLCYEQVTSIKQKHPHIKRIYVRAEYPDISENYKNYLLKYYEGTYYPQNVLDSGRAAYIKRNEEMIQKSDFCVFYYNETFLPSIRKSGTKIALDYAARKGKEIIILSFS